MAQHIARHPLLASADDFPFLARSQWPDTLLNADQSEGVSDLRCFLVEKILSAIRDLGVDCLHAPLLARAPGSGEGGLVLGGHSRILNLDARRKRHAFLEADIRPPELAARRLGVNSL
jgi:hypothetical protein